MDKFETIESIKKHNLMIYDAICLGTLGSNEHDRMVLYLHSIMREVLQGAEGGSFSISYIQEKVSKLVGTAEQIAEHKIIPTT